MVTSEDIEKNLKLNITTKLLLNKMIGQMKQFQGIIGRKKTQETVDSQNLPQEHKDYIYMKMGWL